MVLRAPARRYSLRVQSWLDLGRNCTAGMTGTIHRVRAESLHTRLVDELRARRRPDSGFPVASGGGSEVEPTAVAALALQDKPARAWLRERQGSDGGFSERDATMDGPTTAALAALALAPGSRPSRALRFAVRHRSLQPPGATDPDSVEAGAGQRRPLDGGADRPRSPRHDVLTPTDPRPDSRRSGSSRSGSAQTAVGTTETPRSTTSICALRADHRDRTHRAPARPSAIVEPGIASCAVVAARARRADRGAGARRVPPPRCGGRGGARGFSAGTGLPSAVVPLRSAGACVGGACEWARRAARPLRSRA